MTDALHAPALTAAIAAAAVGLFLVPAAERVASWAGFVAVPRVGPRRGVAYLGGPAVALAVLGASQLGRTTSAPMGLALLLATGLGIVGLIDDHHQLTPLVRFVAEASAATLFVLVTGPLGLTGMHGLDVAFTVIWIVAVLNGINFLDNSDALAAFVTGLSAVGLAAVAGAHTTEGVCAAAVAGACAAFTAFNLRPAVIYLGDAGSMFLGFLLPALALQFVRGAAEPVHATGTVLVVLALPVIEIAITSVRRMAHGRRFWASAPDNLSYALVRRGLGASGALAVHVSAQALLLAVGTAIYRGSLPASAAVAVVGGELLLFAVATRGAAVHGADTHWTRGARLITFVAVTLAIGLGAAGAFAVAAAYRTATAGAAALDVAARRLQAGDTQAARTSFADAERNLARADGLLRPLALATHVVPGLAQNVNAAYTLVDAGHALARDAARFSGAVDTRSMHLRNGAVPIAAVRASQPSLDALAESVARAEHRIGALDGRMLVAPVARKLASVRAVLSDATSTTGNAAAAAHIVPGAFGADGDRHYLVIAQNPAEARATGGIPASFGVLTAHDGTIDLGDLIPVEQLDARAQFVAAPAAPAPAEYLARYGRFDPQLWWENVPMSPDFPTVASVMVRAFEQQTHTKVDGVISVDPIALRALLKFSGPVHVPAWPTAITADNVVDIVLRDEYARFDDAQERKEFLGQVTSAAWKAMQRADLGDPARLAATLGPVAQARHLLVWLAHADEQRVVRNLGLDGRAPEPTGDTAFATVQNAAGTKLDLYATRALRYDVTVDPVDTDHANVHGSERISIANHAPANLPPFVEDPEDGHSHVGELHSFVSIYSGLDLTDTSINGAPGVVQSGREFGRHVYSTFVSAARGQSTDVGLTLQGSVSLDAGAYELRVLPQPSAHDETVDADVHIVPGWSIDHAAGCQVLSTHECRRRGTLASAGTITILLRPD